MHMLPEALGVVLGFAILTLIGIGPALLALGPESRLPRALAIAPAVGLTLAGLLAFPLVRYVGPPRVWGWPLVLLLGGLSLALLARSWRGLGITPAAAVRRIAGPAAVVGVCLLILVTPLLVRGIPYAVYRANGGDAFVYVSHGESLQKADWKTFTAASHFSNTEGVQALAAQTPAGLYTARTTLVPLAMNKAATHAWLAELAGVDGWRFYYAFHLIPFAAAGGVAMALAHLLGLRRRLACLAGLGVSVGFWARWVLESDASYQIAATPLLLLTAFAWALVEAETPRLLSPARVLLGLTAAGIIAFYSPLLQVLGCGAVLFYVLTRLGGAPVGKQVLYHGVTVAIAVGTLAVTGQLDYLYRNLLILAANPSSVYAQGQVFSGPLAMIERDGAATFWGLPSELLFAGLPQKLKVPVRFVCDGMGVFLTLATAGVVWAQLRRKVGSAQRVVLALAAGGVLTTILLVVADRSANNIANFAAGKALTFVYPFPILLVLTSGRWGAECLPPFQTRAVTALCALWLVMQGMVGLFLPLKRSPLRPFSIAQETKLEDYDLSPLERYLDAHPPKKLIVYTPKEDRWLFPLYVMYTFGRFHPHYQSGIVIDNDPRTPNVWLKPLGETPDYAVVSRGQDYVGRLGLGRAVAETRELVLYELRPADLSIYNGIEDELNRKEHAAGSAPRLIGEPGGAPGPH